MKFFYQVLLVISLVALTVVFCFGWIKGGQVPAHASDMVVSADSQVAALLGAPLQSGLVYSKSKLSDDTAKAYYNRGTNFYEKGDYGAAIKYLSMAVTLEPKAPDIYFNRGLSYRRLHKIDEAISDFEKAIQLNSYQSKYYLERCNALIVKNDFDGAITDCSKAIKLSPAEPEPYLLRGVALMFNDHLDEALVDAFKALKIRPDYRDAKRLLYEILLKREAAQPIIPSTELMDGSLV